MRALNIEARNLKAHLITSTSPTTYLEDLRTWLGNGGERVVVEFLVHDSEPGFHVSVIYTE
jgi:hypothetical protein